MTKLEKGVLFNPKKLPNEKIGTCKGEEHEGNRRNQKVRLSMQFLDEPSYDENTRFEPNTEKYLCEECWESECE